MAKTYSTTLHCQSCVATVKPHLDALPGVITWSADTNAHPVTLTVEGTADRSAVAKALALAGYAITDELTPTETNKPDYSVIVLLFSYLVLGTAAAMVAMKQWHTMHAMRYFMAGFFLAFSFFKLLDLRGFARSYARYDLLSRQWAPWGFLYPFVELGLGWLYLADMACVYVNAFALILAIVGLAGVVRVMVKREQVKCACVGAGFNLPVSTVTLLENGIMAAMAAAMLLL
jgi:copper chaperone CopZ